MQGIPPGEILALAYNNKAAYELEERLKQKGVKGVKAVTHHTFASQCILEHFYDLAGFQQKPFILDGNDLSATFAEAMRPVTPLFSFPATAM